MECTLLYKICLLWELLDNVVVTRSWTCCSEFCYRDKWFWVTTIEPSDKKPGDLNFICRLHGILVIFLTSRLRTLPCQYVHFGTESKPF
jgi:hypothetical protein